MARHTRGRQWDADDLTLQHLYGLSLFKPEEAKPQFGSGINLPLTVGTFVGSHRTEMSEKGTITIKREGKTAHLPPTVLNLSWHFGYMQWALDNIATIVRQSKGKIQVKDIDERFFIAAQDFAKREFEQKRIIPLRKALLEAQHPMYLYCVPSVSIETELTSGKPLTIEGDRILCVLPKSLTVAQQYGLSEPEIQLIAPQVMWLVQLLCSICAIRSPKQLAEAIDGWTQYLNPTIMEQVQESIGVHSPYLITENGFTL